MESVWNGFMLKTMGTMSKANQRRVHKFGAYKTRSDTSEHKDDNPYLSQKRDGDTCTEELAQMLGGELAKHTEDVSLDLLGLFFRIIGRESDERGREIGVVDRIVNGYGDLEAGVVVHHHACDTSPHRLNQS